MRYQEIAVLSETLQASSIGKPVLQSYRAILCRDEGGTGRFQVKIMQCVKGNWSCCGTWRLTTLLYGYPHNLNSGPSDGLSLDFGQQWQIDSGMREALEKAIEII